MDPVAALLERARKGDREAFEGLVRRYLPAVYEIVRVTAKGRGVPGDLVRETFHRAWRGLAGLDPRSDFGRWLGAVARYVSDEAVERREPFSVARGFESRDETWTRTFGALAELPDDEREAMLLRHLDGLDGPAAAGRLGIEEAAFDDLARRAREALRGRLPTPGEAAS